jgi:hypothetical protein
MSETSRRRLELRIVVGTSPRHLASSVWRIWQGKHTDDIYIAPRGIAGSLKCSLHASRYCYLGFTRQAAERMVSRGQRVPVGRAITRWERPIVPENEYKNVVGITIPASPLREYDKPIDKPTWLIQPPSQGKATVIGITFSRLSEGVLTLGQDQREIGYTRLSTGEYVLVFCARSDFNKEEFKTSVDGKRLLNFHTKGIAVPESEYMGKPLRLLAINDAEKEHKLRILDLAVVASKRNHAEPRIIDPGSGR